MTFIVILDRFELGLKRFLEAKAIPLEFCLLFQIIPGL